MNCKINFSESKVLNLFLGETHIYAEGNNNKGIYWNMGFSYWIFNGFKIGLSIGLLRYSQENITNQYFLDSTISFKLRDNLEKE